MARYFYWFILTACALLSGCGGCEQKEPYTGNPNPLWDLHKVYGRVKTARVEYFEPMMKNGKLVPGSHVGESITVDSMDAEGKLLISKTFSLGGGLKKTENFIYNPEGQIIAIESRNSNGDLTTSQEIYYNDKGQKLKQVVTLHLPDGKQSFWRTWQYDGIGQMIETYVYRTDSTIDNREVLTYYENDSGKIHTHTLFVGADTLKYKNEYIYASSGYDSIMHRYRPLNENDSVGYQSRYVYTHDNNGNELTRKMLTPDGVVRATTSYEYVFDHHNNWIQRFETVDGEPNVVKVRTFTYYDE